MIHREIGRGIVSRSDADLRAFHEAHRLLVAFGVAAIPATLMLAVMGIDFLEGDAGLAGGLVMALAGGASIVSAVVSVRARRAWRAGEPLGRTLAVMYRPLLLLVGGVFLYFLALAAELSVLLRRP